MTESHSLNVLIALALVAVLAVAVLLLVDRVKKHRDGVGLAILEDRPPQDFVDDRPPDPDFFADIIRNKQAYRDEMLADWAENREDR